MNGFKKTVLAATAALVLGLASNSLAVMSLTFDDDSNTQDGTVSYAGGATPLIGSGIDFVSIKGTDTPLNNNVTLTCESCVLEFTTGNAISTVGATTTFAGGGSFTLTGSAYNGAILPVNLIASGNLISGTFGSPLPTFINGGGLGIFASFGPDSKNTDLAAFYGVPADQFQFGHTDITAAVTSNGNGGFDAVVSNADIENNVVPEPGTMLLMGSGLLGLGFWRKFKK